MSLIDSVLKSVDLVETRLKMGSLEQAVLP